MRLDLKKNYSSREVASITGLSARQLQWWDTRKLIKPSIASHRTEAGGFTERRYSPVDLFELAVLADLRRNGLSVSKMRLLVDTLRKRGVTPIEALGADFDPNFHMAVLHEPAEGHRDNEVIEEFTRGYMLGDRLLRPAMVKVAKG